MEKTDRVSVLKKRISKVKLNMGVRFLFFNRADIYAYFRSFYIRAI